MMALALGLLLAVSVAFNVWAVVGWRQAIAGWRESNDGWQHTIDKAEAMLSTPELFRPVPPRSRS